jgi:hypothetical protein
MGLGEEVKKLRFDKRLLESNVARGLVSKADQQKHLADLPDLASNVENLGLVRGSAGGSPAMNDGDFGSEDQDA